MFAVVEETLNSPKHESSTMNSTG